MALSLRHENDLSYIERPCRLYDMFCIRQYFAKHSRCKEALGPAPTPLYKAQSTFYLPRVNLTVTSNRLRLTGINGQVVEFYINKKTNKLLLAVEFKDFTASGDEHYFRFHRRGKEPIVNMDPTFNVTYSSFVVTIIIPNLKDLRFEDSESFLYTNDPTPRMVVGPRAFSGTDPQVQETFVKYIENLSANQKEGLLIEETFYIGSFIQYNICDFGIELL
ncbi:fibrohexamerin-like [Maniola hyperantus]|uniref:fibrohexamerin-like n=1 Tax=Aphantopus hyperantus TaxID=2795564 RepID=UPI003748BA02